MTPAKPQVRSQPRFPESTDDVPGSLRGILCKNVRLRMFMHSLCSLPRVGEAVGARSTQSAGGVQQADAVLVYSVELAAGDVLAGLEGEKKPCCDYLQEAERRLTSGQGHLLTLLRSIDVTRPHEVPRAGVGGTLAVSAGVVAPGLAGEAVDAGLIFQLAGLVEQTQATAYVEGVVIAVGVEVACLNTRKCIMCAKELLIGCHHFARILVFISLRPHLVARAGEGHVAEAVGLGRRGLQLLGYHQQIHRSK